MRTNTSSLMDGKDYKKRNFVFSDDHSVDTNKMVSSVEWLVEQLLIYGDKAFNKEITLGEYHIKKQELIEQAKAMHKVEIINANWEASEDTDRAEQYYYETFKSE